VCSLTFEIEAVRKEGRMATIINNPGGTTDANNGTPAGMGFLLGIILLIVFLVFLFYYGIPALSRGIRSTAPQVNVPGKIDVNVNTPQNGGTQPQQGQ